MTRPLSVLTACALSCFMLAGCFDLTSSSTEDDKPSGTGHWSDEGTTTNPLIVLGHRFNTARIGNGYPDKGDVCTIYATVEFTAPYNEYVRFQAKITMTDGSWVKSPIFFNETAGSRKYTFKYDTSNDNCWGGRRHYAGNLHVGACRGMNCTPRIDD
ncbi:MAG: hypothetical protein KDI55_27865 [Anaerolineae bacterium]|nr:hypothetical protein [Anaerolineae bacterium]